MCQTRPVFVFFTLGDKKGTNGGGSQTPWSPRTKHQNKARRSRYRLGSGAVRHCSGCSALEPKRNAAGHDHHGFAPQRVLYETTTQSTHQPDFPRRFFILSLALNPQLYGTDKSLFRHLSHVYTRRRVAGRKCFLPSCYVTLCNSK